MKVRLLIIIFAILTVCGCNVIDELTHFDKDYNYIFTLKAYGGVSLDNVDIESNDIENDTESTFEINDTRKDLVERATLKKFNVTILEPTDAKFNFLNKVEVFLRTDDLEEKLIAWNDNIPSDVGNYLKLETTNSNLRKYLTSDAIKVRLKTTSSNPFKDDLLLDLKSTVEVDAKILGI